MCPLLGGFLDELDGHMRTFKMPKALSGDATFSGSTARILLHYLFLGWLRSGPPLRFAE
jgi:hypothetical protein